MPGMSINEMSMDDGELLDVLEAFDDLLAHGKHIEILELSDRYTRKPSLAIEPVALARLLLRRAQALGELRYWYDALRESDRAVQILEKCNGDEHWLVEALCLYGKALIKCGMTAEAIEPLARAVALAPRGLSRGALLARLMKYLLDSKAVECAVSALIGSCTLLRDISAAADGTPELRDQCLWVLRFCASQARFDVVHGSEALDEAIRTVRLVDGAASPFLVQLLCFRSLLSNDLDDSEGARILADEAVDLSRSASCDLKDLSLAYRTASIAALESGRRPAAIRYIEEEIALAYEMSDPSTARESAFLAANLLEKSGRAEKAVVMLKRLLYRYPDAETAVKLADLLIHLDRHDEAQWANAFAIDQWARNEDTEALVEVMTERAAALRMRGAPEVATSVERAIVELLQSRGGGEDTKNCWPDGTVSEATRATPEKEYLS